MPAKSKKKASGTGAQFNRQQFEEACSERQEQFANSRSGGSRVPEYLPPINEDDDPQRYTCTLTDAQIKTFSPRKGSPGAGEQHLSFIPTFTIGEGKFADTEIPMYFTTAPTRNGLDITWMLHQFLRQILGDEEVEELQQALEDVISLAQEQNFWVVLKIGFSEDGRYKRASIAEVLGEGDEAPAPGEGEEPGGGEEEEPAPPPKKRGKAARRRRD